jgi:hypothetical protein
MMNELSFEIDPSMKEGGLYLASLEPSSIKCLNGMYLHRVCIEEEQVLVKVDESQLAKPQ